MEGQLLVRMYNVGLGDCIYLRVPDKSKDVHILIDCGNKFSDQALLDQCIGELKKELPDAGSNKKKLDLLLVSHPHEDHHKGFEEALFKDIKIGKLWLSPAYNRQNPDAQGFRALQDAALRALMSLKELAFGERKLEIDELLRLSKEEAFEMLCTTLPQANGIEPLYVSADTPSEQLRIFEDPAIELKVLGPMADIDSFYLGGEGLLAARGGLNPLDFSEGYGELFQDIQKADVGQPDNISSRDFKQLRGRMYANALAAVEFAGHVANNLSVVLLLEWHGRRLLFPGDAEWHKARKGEVQKGRSNGSWNVMWQERKADFSRPLDFLKVGHHGSENATPWTSKKSSTGEEHAINQVLNALLPLPGPGQSPTAHAVVSTERTKRWPTIPDPDLMVELGRRIANARTAYREPPSPKAVPPDLPQPPRTDLEAQATDTPDKPVKFIEIRYSP